MKSKDIWGEGCQQEMGRLCTFKPAVAEKFPQLLYAGEGIYKEYQKHKRIY